MVRPEPKVKSFEIDKRLVYGAWEKVRRTASSHLHATSSRHLYTGHHRGHTQAAPRLRAHPEKRLS